MKDKSLEMSKLNLMYSNYKECKGKQDHIIKLDIHSELTKYLNLIKKENILSMSLELLILLWNSSFLTQV